MEFPEIIEILQLFSALMASITANPIYSVLFLIISYLLSSISIIYNDFDFFIGMLLIMIYIGAVAVLFLFSILLLDLHSSAIFGIKTAIMSLFFLSIFLFFSEFFFIFFNTQEFDMELDTEDEYIDWIDNFYASSEAEILGHLLYNEYNLALLLGIIALFISLIGAITISLSGAVRLRRQITNLQVGRQTNAFLRYKK